MTDWQALIRQAALEGFTRTGRKLTFRLARPDLVELASSVSGHSVEDITAGVSQAGFAGMRCLVWSEPMGHQIIVDEWFAAVQGSLDREPE